jgi:hypothetical protein
LIKSNQCGILDANGVPIRTLDLLSVLFNANSQVTTASTYAQTCYGPPTSSIQYSLYVKEQLEWTTNSNAICPCGEDLCILKETKPIQLDTGLIDSQSDLGINTAPENRVSDRTVSTRAPIHTEGFTSFRNSSSSCNASEMQNDDPLIQDPDWTDTGPWLDLSYGTWNTTQDSNETYSYSMQSYSIVDGYDLRFVLPTVFRV